MGFLFGAHSRVREICFKLPATLSPAISRRNLMPSLLGGVENILTLYSFCDIINLKRKVRKLTDILLFGIFHFFEEKIDFSSDTVQRQLDDLSYAVSKFAPSAVAVELEKEKYGEKVCLLDVNWKQAFTREQFYFGGRIATNSGLKVLHPIDKIFPLNADMVNPENMQLIIPRLQYLQKLDEIDNINEKCRFINSAQYVSHDANMYLDINSQNRNGDYFESKCLSEWYFRNLCIFSNLQHVAKEHDRIVVLYGAGHIPILRDLINMSDSMNLVDINDYI